jgi:hypothetical protein
MVNKVTIMNPIKIMKATIIEIVKKFAKEKEKVMLKLRCWSSNLIDKDHGLNKKF